MPELPEVETVRRGLADHLAGRRITSVEVLHPRAVRRQAPDVDLAVVAGRTIGGVRRRGKYLWLVVDPGDAILAHLGMSGQFRFVPVGTPAHPHLRIRLGLDDGRDCWFLDQRTFGGMQLSPGGAAGPAEIAHIAPDLLEPGLDRVALNRRIRTRHSAIKRVLLDQTITSGIGNIYADEALWRARVHPERLADRLSRATVAGLITAVDEVFAEALAAGGTSFDALYVNVNGESGYFARFLHSYGRGGEPCYRCGALIVREPFMNRSSYFCPRCQRRQRR